jgi:hypothetical protein
MEEVYGGEGKKRNTGSAARNGALAQDRQPPEILDTGGPQRSPGFTPWAT